MNFEGMKRKELQALCKKHGVPANLANREMANRLALLLQEGEKPAVSHRKTNSVIVANKGKKVKFSPENETFIFVESDSGSDSDKDYVPERMTRLRNRKSMRENATKWKNFEEEKEKTGKVRVTRSRAKRVSVLEEYSKLVSSPVNGRKRGKEIIDASQPNRESTGPRLRRKLANEAAGFGDLAVSGNKILQEGLKKNEDGKAGYGALSEDAAAQMATKPEKINENSKRNSIKDKGLDVAAADGIGKVGIGGRTSRARTRAFGTGSADNSKCEESLKCLGKKETAVENNSKMRSKKQELEEVSDIKPSSDATEQFMPEGRTRRTRRITRLFSAAGVTGSTNEEASETINQERGANGWRPPEQSASVAPKVADIAEGASKEGLNELSFVNVQEPSNNKCSRRSAHDTSKGNNDEHMERTRMGMAAEKNKWNTSSLPIEEPPVNDVKFAAPEALESKTDPDIQCRKVDTQRSSEDRREYRRKSAVTSSLHTTPITSVNKAATDLEGQLSASECQDISVVDPAKESVVELFIKEKENNIVEEVGEISRDENVEVGRGDPLCNSLDESGDSSDYKLVQQVEELKKHIDAGFIIRESSLSLTSQVNSEGERSNLLGIEERLEPEESVIVNSMCPGSNEVYDQSSNYGKSDSGQDHHLDEVGKSGESGRYAENLSEEAENTRPSFPQDVNAEMVEKINFPNIILSNSAAVPSEPATEDGSEIPYKTTFSRETGFSVEYVQARHDVKTEEISTTKEQEPEEASNNGLPSIVAIATDIPVNVDDALDGEGADDVNESGYGHAYDSQNFSKDKNYTNKKVAIAEDKENRGAGNDKSKAGSSNEDQSDATNEWNQEYNVSIPEFSEELFDDHKGAAEEAASVNDDNLTPNQLLCDSHNGTDNVAKQTEDALDFHATNVDYFVSSPDNRESELHVQTAEVTALEMNMSLRIGEEGNVCELFAEANTGSENDERKKEIEENVKMTEEFDQAFESQPGEHDHHITGPAVSKDLISGDSENSKEQDDVSAIIQGYMERETHIDELTKMDSFGPLNEGKMTRVSVEDAETNCVAEPGLDKVSSDSGEEDKEAPATSTKRMEIGEEDKDTVTAEMELPKINDAAPTDCTDVVIVNHEISETPNAIPETTMQSEEVKFEDHLSNMEVSIGLDRSASMALDNSAFDDGKATNRKGKVGGEGGDLNSQAINFLTETKVNLDPVPDVISDEILNELAGEEMHVRNDNDPDTALISTHGKKAGSTDEAGDESLEGRIGSDDVKCDTELLGEVLNSPPKVEESCRLDEKNSTAIKLMIGPTVCSPLTGKESECQAYKNCPTNFVEGMELENRDGGIIPREIDSPKQGNKLELNNLFSSDSSKIDFKQSRKDLDFQNSENLEVPFGASKDTADLEEVLFIRKPEKGVQSPAVSLATAASNACRWLTTTDSQREELDKIYERRLEENLMSETSEDVKKGDTAVNTSTVSAEQGFHLENEMVDIDLLKQNQLVASDEPSNENEGSKQEGNYESGGLEDVTSFAITSIEEVTVETANLNKYGLEINATMMENAASDEPVTVCGGLAGKGGVFIVIKDDGPIEFKNSVNFAASTEPTAECGADDSKQVECLEETGIEGIPALIKNDSIEDMFETMDSSGGASVTNVESLDESIFGNRGTNEKCENNKDDIVQLEKCQETTEFHGSSSASSKHTTELGGKESNKGDNAPLNLDVKVALSEDAQSREADFEFGQEKSSETNLFERINEFANPTKKNNINVSIPATPKNLQKAHDMKENLQSAKREQFGSAAVSRKSAKRRPLEDLQKN